MGYADLKEFTNENLPLPLSGEVVRGAASMAGNDAAHEQVAAGHKGLPVTIQNVNEHNVYHPFGSTVLFANVL